MAALAWSRRGWPAGASPPVQRAALDCLGQVLLATASSALQARHCKLATGRPSKWGPSGAGAKVRGGLMELVNKSRRGGRTSAFNYTPKAHRERPPLAAQLEALAFALDAPPPSRLLPATMCCAGSEMAATFVLGAFILAPFVLWKCNGAQLSRPLASSNTVPPSQNWPKRWLFRRAPSGLAGGVGR